MPCSDITETINIKLDSDNRLVAYSFLKRACGGNIGQKDLLIQYLKDYTADEIINFSQTEIINRLQPENPTERFLALKHLSAIQYCLGMFNGNKDYTPNSTIKIYSIIYDEDGVELEADVKLELNVKNIAPCNNCDCG